uniref:Bestrophin homolog n=1 Tax=Grammatophora oceanica TaxID=210454 RepID=A0A7S1Y3W0_9STRA|mmetsp:Transcript_22754/g.33741  ORF Transcript_22754/g.33741 Transcript_22754/m.33741 type:complete len:389 (+) Transcript_22754:111-1277(+)|eukprot:CAMPEP_0194048994 /NCGR_PEP_ID=MMETSP0009_2-20130614/29288_1 /TAXON_ID=210454 /ORGANISM="Grammatophora oceanica, Strain CCMP 410" /LENGTH=388 /DNA_ID=CAMNT_0038695043 /DNA_START=105 /DNA_END=1271 /DNA_ORIENTATION=+
MGTDERHGYTVTYHSESHWSVITQMWGSVWPRVLPYCLFNVGLTALIHYLDAKEYVSLAISNVGHTFMNLMVAFLIVSRVTMSIARYSEARGYLAVIYRESRELIQNMIVFSGDHTHQEAKEWRNLVAYRTCILLRTSMAVIDYASGSSLCWELPEISPEEHTEIKRFVYFDTGEGDNNNALRWAHGERTEGEENMRVPIRMAFKLRQAIRMQRQALESKPIETSQENKMLGSVDSFMVGYYGMRKFLTTPFPFPLVQMARTFLFFYVFTVPFALLSDDSAAVAHCVVIFILTYGFMGLEYVSIELDNPFGDDDNDFDNLGMALTAFEDTYLAILEMDGAEWTERLRHKMGDCGYAHDGRKTTSKASASPSNASGSTEQSWLLESNGV